MHCNAQKYAFGTKNIEKICQSNKKVANNKGFARIEKLARFLLIK